MIIQASNETEMWSKKNLNLGCGQFPIQDALNVDVLPHAKADLILNLDDLEAYSVFPRNHYKNIYLYHVLEHLDDVFGTMRKCFEILEPGGSLQIRVPHASRGFTHAEHRHGFDVGFPLYFNQKLTAFYYGPSFDLVSMRLTWAIRFDLYEMVAPKWQVGILKFLNAVLTPLANASPGFCSRIWCYWVGGFEQIEYIFKKPLA